MGGVMRANTGKLTCNVFAAKDVEGAWTSPIRYTP
jgi:hypothetical protein